MHNVNNSDESPARERIRDCFSAIRKLQSELANPEKIDAELRQHRERIKYHEKQIDDLEEILLCGEDRIKTLFDEIADAREVLAAVANEKRAGLQAEFDKLAAELAACGNNPKAFVSMSK